MAEEYVKGRLPQESNPTPGRYPGFVASHDTTGNEDYRPTSPDNPLPTSNYIQRESGVWVPISKDNPMPTQLTGSNVVQDVNVLGNYVDSEEIAKDFHIAAGATGYVPTASGIDTDCTGVILVIMASDLVNHKVSVSSAAYYSHGLVLPRIPMAEEVLTVNYRMITDEVSPRTPRTSFRIENLDTVSHTYTVGLIRLYSSKSNLESESD